MEKSKIDMFMSMNASNFKPSDLALVKDRLEKLDDEKFFLIQGIQFQKPDTIFLIAILLGWERFWLNDVGMGVAKVLTGYGCMIWWLMDIISAKERAMKFNFDEFNKAMMFV